MKSQIINHSVDSSGKSVRTGFTIIELMVVVALIAMLIGFSVPVVFKIDESTRDRSGVNTFGVAVTAARAYATRKIADDDSNPLASYSGAAIVVTPFNELRLVGDVQEMGFEPSNLYRDIVRTEPISMPRGMGAAGIVKDASGFRLLAPPFAIKFNERGHLVSGTDVGGGSVNTVYYDMSGDGTVNLTGSARPAGYNPKTYDPEMGTAFVNIDQGTGKQIAATFEELETVIGVVIYSKADFEDAGGAWPSTRPEFGCKNGVNEACQAGAAGVYEWMLDNGSVLFFSRYTGQIIRQNAP